MSIPFNPLIRISQFLTVVSRSFSHRFCEYQPVAQNVRPNRDMFINDPTDPLICVFRIAVWSRSRWIVVPLIILIIGHFGLLLHGKYPTLTSASPPPHLPHPYAASVTISGMWLPGKGCITTYADGSVLMATFIYTMCFDFIILSLMTIRLYKISAHSTLRTLVFKDGLIYFLIL